MRIAGVALLLALHAFPCGKLAAQVPTPDELRQLQSDPELIRERLRASGLTPDQIRARLAAAGYSPNLLDRYLEDEDAQEGAPSEDMLRALETLGVTEITPEGLEAVQLLTGAGPALIPEEPQELALFGLDVFRGPTSQFQPVLSGPVPPTYRIGPGDALVLVLTGEVELVHELTVTREGFIVIPQVGQLAVNNVRMDELEELLRRRLGRSYSGIRTGSTQFHVTIASLRANQVFVVGEVVQPGAYQLASVATALNALYAAGGPTERANLRAVQIRRGDSTVATLDLYDYLLRADTRNDRVLEQGDIIFVPLRGARVAMTGAVTRPAIYELAAGQTLAQVLEAAGGLRAHALLDRITVHRILPAAERGPGPALRAALTVALPADSNGVRIPPFPLLDGDSVVVHELPLLTDMYTVQIGGMVREPGRFPWREGMTLRDLIRLAGGPQVGADLREAEVARLPADRQAGALADTLRVPMDSSYLVEPGRAGRFVGPPGPPLPPPGSQVEFTLEPYDQALILRQPEFEYQRTVTVTGEVRFPGPYALTRKSERVSDLVQRAGGVTSTAYPAGARFFRSLDDAGRVNIDLPQALARRGQAFDIILQPGDSLDVPEYIPTVRVSGAVNSPTSVLYREGEGLAYYIDNAGGYARNADKGRVSVRYANGSARVKSKFLFFSSSPQPGPGSVVTVPTKPEGEPFNVTQFLASIAQVLASTVAILVIATR